MTAPSCWDGANAPGTSTAGFSIRDCMLSSSRLMLSSAQAGRRVGSDGLIRRYPGGCSYDKTGSANVTAVVTAGRRFSGGERGRVHRPMREQLLVGARLTD